MKCDRRASCHACGDGASSEKVAIFCRIEFFTDVKQPGMENFLRLSLVRTWWTVYAAPDSLTPELQPPKVDVFSYSLQGTADGDIGEWRS